MMEVKTNAVTQRETESEDQLEGQGMGGVIGLGDRRLAGYLFEGIRYELRPVGWRAIQG